MRWWRFSLLVWCFVLVALPGRAAQDPGSLRGTVVDPLGGRVSGAVVALMRGGDVVGQATTGGAGEFAFEGLAPGRYEVRAESPGFEPQTAGPVFVGGSSRVALDVTLRIGPLQQDVVVTAAAAELPASRTGAPVTVVDAATLDALHKIEIVEALRLVPGAQVVETGQRGGAASVFIRGGNSNFNKVLVDGISVNEIGGAFDFSPVAAAGIERVEVLRQSNSVLYGSDALSGVISLTTRRGRSRVPELSYAIDGGSFGTLHNDLSAGGAIRRFDYFSEFAQFETDNDVPNGRFTNRTYAGRFSVALGSGTDLSGTVRHAATDAGAPGGIGFFGIADDSRQDASQTYVTVTAESQHTTAWQSTMRLGATGHTSRFVNPAPTGEPFDPFGFGPNYLGEIVTLRAGSGASITGRAILDFGGEYPVVFEQRTTRRTIFGQTTYQVMPDLSLSGGARLEGEAAYDDPDGDPAARRTNHGLFAEARGTLARRVHAAVGVGYDRNEAFGSAVTPRLSLAVYLRNPSPSAVVGDTKLVFNAGRGIKAPSVFQEQSSLFSLVEATAAGSRVEPIAPERSRSVDLGIEQGLARGRVRLRAAYFDNEFADLIEFVTAAVLPQLGVPPAAAAAAGSGAYVNSSSFRARGLEASLEVAPVSFIRMSGSYTFVDAVVTESFSSGALAPAINPAFPETPIGAFSPLVGARPFRRPAHSGSLLVRYAQGPVQVALAGYFSGARDDSTFLSDPFFGSAMLLPNRDLAPGYQKVDLSASYQLHARLRGYLSVENLLNQSYAASFGYPSLPLGVRGGVRVTLGGD